MTERQRLHQLVETLDEALIPRAMDILEALDHGADPLAQALAPVDDEPAEDATDGGLSKAGADESVSHEDAKKQLLG